MPNETETPANAELNERASAITLDDQETRELPPFPPRPESEIGYANGRDGVGKQYRAIQEAQMLHEETLKQLREEIKTQKMRLAELSDATSYSGRTPQLDAVFLRLSELERKMGEGAPDPLLNEIVHRLAAIENSGHQKQQGQDRRVDELITQVDKLRKRASEPADDSRVDDVVLRIASLESAYRRASQSGEIEGLSSRVEALRGELEETRRGELERFQRELRELSEAWPLCARSRRPGSPQRAGRAAAGRSRTASAGRSLGGWSGERSGAPGRRRDGCESDPCRAQRAPRGDSGAAARRRGAPAGGRALGELGAAAHGARATARRRLRGRRRRAARAAGGL